MIDTVFVTARVAEFTTIIQNVVLAACAVLTVLIAYKGLKTWRKELKGKSEYAKAKEVLKAVFKVRRAFMHVRFPGINSYEYPESMLDRFGHLREEHAYEGTAYVYNNRLKILEEAFGELEEQTLDAEVEWEIGFQDAIIRMRQCKMKLQLVLWKMLETKKNPQVNRETSPEDFAREQSVLYYLGEDSEIDKFTPEINAAVELYEQKLRPYIKE